MSSSFVANDQVTVEANAKLPMWFARNVCQVCDGVVFVKEYIHELISDESLRLSGEKEFNEAKSDGQRF